MSNTGPSKGRTRRMVSALLVVVLVLATVLILSSSGLISAQLQSVSLEGRQGRSDGDSRTVSIRFGIRNEAWSSVTIVGAGRSSSYMRLLKVEDTRLPITLWSGETARLEFVYQVTDCDNMPNEEWPIPVEVERPWGTQTIYLDPPRQKPNFSRGSTQAKNESISWPWYAARASYVCDWHL